MDVHVWTVGIGDDQPNDIRRSRAALLTPDELQRAGRFARDVDRHRFVLCRGAVRLILARYTSRSPADLVFAAGPHGKPSLVCEDRGRPGACPAFNVSHSGELAVVAVAAHSPVGIDVEQIRPMPDADRLAARFFSAYEYDAYRSHDPEARLSAFFRCWTRKEAFIKACGDGLSLPLAYFDVTLTASEQPRILIVGGSADEARHWTLQAIEPATGYVGAVAVRMRDVRLSSFEQ
jgi:4'-phosphopantetheinyl transferase